MTRIVDRDRNDLVPPPWCLSAAAAMFGVVLGGAADPPASGGTAAPPATAQPEAPPLQFDSWTLATGRPDAASPAHFIAYVKSANGDLFGFGCDKAGQTPVYGIFFSQKYMAGGSMPKRDLEYVIDRGQVHVAKWDYLEHYALMRDPDLTSDIAAGLVGGRSLDVRAFTYELFAVDVHFDITGGKPAIETLFKDCRQR